MTENVAMVCLSDFEQFAEKILPKNAIDYYRSGADEQITLKENIKAFSRYKILPKVLVNVSERDISTTILGHRISFPVCISPTAMHCMAHPEGEMATARGAMVSGVGFALSTIATSSIEQVAAAAPDALRFFQLYIYRERDVTLQLVRRAEENGFKALILTVDTPFFGKRRNDNRNKFKLPPHLRMANFDQIDFKGRGVNKADSRSGLNEYASSLFDASLTWADVIWLKSVTKLPLILKGLLTPADALAAVNIGVHGIIVSNHGARQLDTVPASISMLGKIVDAVAGRCEVYMDGGIRSGTDVFKALALGARAVFVGRPAIYAVAYNGSDGVSQMLQILKDEFSVAMGLTGCTTVSDISSDLLRVQSPWQSDGSKL